MSFQQPVSIKSLIVNAIDRMTTDTSAADVTLCYFTGDDKSNLVPLKSQEQLEEYLNIIKRPALYIVNDSNELCN